MDNDLESIGTAITGGLAARAVEPDHGEGGGRERICSNCATPLIGTHCHLCGQKAHVHRSIAAIGHELLHSVLHLDGKFWRTLPLLALRPGELTRRYAAGERAKFVSPFGMFLFSVFLMFAILQIAGVSLSNIDLSQERVSEVARERIEAELERARIEAETGEAPADEDLATISSSSDPPEERIAELEGILERMDDADAPNLQIFGDGISTGWHRLDEGIEKLEENPSLALYKLQANFYKFSWLLIPLSVPFVWLLFFYTRRFHLYDHTVFVTYSLAFMSLFAIVLTLLGFLGVGAPWIPIAAVVIPAIHMYRQLHNGYQTSRIGALIRTPILATFCFVIATFYFVLLLGIGALG